MGVARRVNAHCPEVLQEALFAPWKRIMQRYDAIFRGNNNRFVQNLTKNHFQGSQRDEE